MIGSIPLSGRTFGIGEVSPVVDVSGDVEDLLGGVVSSVKVTFSSSGIRRDLSVSRHDMSVQSEDWQLAAVTRSHSRVHPAILDVREVLSHPQEVDVLPD